MDSFSAHADYAEMLDYLGCQDPALVKKMFLVHGDYDEQLIWQDKLEAAGFRNIEIPEMKQRFNL